MKLSNILKAIGIIKTIEVDVYQVQPRTNNMPPKPAPLTNFINKAGQYFIFTKPDGQQHRYDTLPHAMSHALIYANNNLICEVH